MVLLNLSGIEPVVVRETCEQLTLKGCSEFCGKVSGFPIAATIFCGVTLMGLGVAESRSSIKGIIELGLGIFFFVLGLAIYVIGRQ